MFTDVANTEDAIWFRVHIWVFEFKLNNVQVVALLSSHALEPLEPLY